MYDNKLKRIRKETGMTLEKLSQLTGVSSRVSMSSRKRK